MTEYSDQYDGCCTSDPYYDPDDLDWGYWDGVANLVWLNWAGITIPAGSTINTAYISVKSDGGKSGTLSGSIVYFENAINPVQPESYADFAARVKTLANINWVPAAWVDGTWYNSPELKTIIQELVDARSYAAGANMQALCVSNAGTNNYWEGYNHASIYKPILHIEYTEAVVGGRACQIIMI
jgi:hypothetical protein